MWSFPFTHLVLARDRLIHFKILHRIYYTPAKLSSIYSQFSEECWRCSHSPATFGHVFWYCSVVQDFWKEVLHCITEVTSLTLTMMVRICLLGLVEGLASTRAQCTLLSLLLFYTRKALILYWKKPVMPSLAYWKGLVNKMVPFCKTTYMSRGCPIKFEKI